MSAPHDTRTSSPALAPDAPTATEKISEIWKGSLPSGSLGWEADHAREIRESVEQLLRGGWTEEQLTASILDPARDRREYPRVWEARLGPRPPKAGPAPRDRQKEAQEAAEARERHAAERLTPEYAAALDRLRRMTGRGSAAAGDSATDSPAP